MKFTRLTNLEVTGKLKAGGVDDTEITQTSAAAAGSAPTKAEFDKAVADIAALTEAVNALTAAIG